MLLPIFSFATIAEAGPPLEAVRVTKLEVRAKRSPPLVVHSACSAAPPSTVSAAALLAELKETRARRSDLVLAEQGLARVRFEIAAERERLAAERIDLDLERDELAGAPARAPAEKPAAASAGDGEEVKKLSATVKAMKADKAAAVVAMLDRALAAQVLRTLSRPAAAAIYDRLAPDVAADLMERIAAFRLASAADADVGGTP